MSRVAHPAGPRHADVLPPDHPPPPPADVNALDPTIWPLTARRGSGALRLGGLDVRDLAAQFGTPVFLCDEADFRGRCRDFRDAFGPGCLPAQDVSRTLLYIVGDERGVLTGQAHDIGYGAMTRLPI